MNTGLWVQIAGIGIIGIIAFSFPENCWENGVDHVLSLRSLDQVFQLTWGTINDSTMGIYGDGNQCWGPAQELWKVGHTPVTSAMDKIPSARLEAPHGYCPDNHIQSIAVCLTVLPSRCDLVFASSFSHSTKSHYDSHRCPSNFGCGKGLFSGIGSHFFAEPGDLSLRSSWSLKWIQDMQLSDMLIVCWFVNSIPFITDDKSSWERLTAAKTFIQWWISCQPFHFGS